MNPETILYPSIAMAALTLGCIFWMGRCRYKAIHARRVSIRFFRTYDEGEQPADLHRIARHVQNHFEVPPLLHVAVLMAFVSGAVSTLTVSLAWAFVALRGLHSVIHLGSNNVSQRFAVFGLSLVALSGLWIAVLLHILGAPA